MGSVRRVLVVEPRGGAGQDVTWARRILSGRELGNEQTKAPEALLAVIPNTDGRLRHYVGLAAVSSTVTPVVLPGHDDRHPAKAERLLRKALTQAGFSDTLARSADLDWRRVGYRPDVELATRYDILGYLKGPRYHVRVRWRGAAGRAVAVRGPVVLGAGRYCGLGLFAADRDDR